MADRLEALDAIYFRADSTWTERLDEWAQKRTASGAFASSHRIAIDLSLQVGLLDARKTPLRMVVNMAGPVLLEFLAQRTYLNGYGRFTQFGGKAPSEMRRRVDSALSQKPEQIHFGAVTLNGTGIRFYGEYGVVLKSAAMPANTPVIDRNSWLIEFPPLRPPMPDPTEQDRRDVVERLSGEWQRDLVAMITLKVLPAVGDETVRLPTTGAISEAVLRDESFVEVLKDGSFEPDDVHEVRETPQDAAIEGDVNESERRGTPVSLEEQIWVRRRRAVAERLAQAGIRRRIVATSGRERG